MQPEPGVGDSKCDKNFIEIKELSQSSPFSPCFYSNLLPEILGDSHSYNLSKYFTVLTWTLSSEHDESDPYRHPYAGQATCGHPH